MSPPASLGVDKTKPLAAPQLFAGGFVVAKVPAALQARESGSRKMKSVAITIAALCLTMHAACADEINRELAVVRCSIATARIAALGVTAQSDDGDGDTNLTLRSGLKASVACMDAYPSLLVPWLFNPEQSAVVASAFLAEPAVTPQVIADKAGECFTSLKKQMPARRWPPTSVTAINFNDIDLQCSLVGDVQGGETLVVHSIRAVTAPSPHP
jgi:hypothetical protein